MVNVSAHKTDFFCAQVIENFQMEHDRLTSRMLNTIYETITNLGVSHKIDFGKTGVLSYDNKPVRSITAETDGLDRVLVFEIYRRDNKTVTETIRVCDGGNFYDIMYWLSVVTNELKR